MWGASAFCEFKKESSGICNPSFNSSADIKCVAPCPRAFMTLLILLMPVGFTLSMCHAEGTVKRAFHESKVQQ